MSRSVRFQKKAIKALGRMPRNEADKVRHKIFQYAENPEALKSNVKKLQGREGLRLRVGNWRVIFDDDGTVLDILEIGVRGSIY